MLSPSWETNFQSESRGFMLFLCYLPVSRQNSYVISRVGRLNFDQNPVDVCFSYVISQSVGRIIMLSPMLED